MRNFFKVSGLVVVAFVAVVCLSQSVSAQSYQFGGSKYAGSTCGPNGCGNSANVVRATTASAAVYSSQSNMHAATASYASSYSGGYTQGTYTAGVPSTGTYVTQYSGGYPSVVTPSHSRVVYGSVSPAAAPVYSSCSSGYSTYGYSQVARVPAISSSYSGVAHVGSVYSSCGY